MRLGALSGHEFGRALRPVLRTRKMLPKPRVGTLSLAFQFATTNWNFIGSVDSQDDTIAAASGDSNGDAISDLDSFAALSR